MIIDLNCLRISFGKLSRKNCAKAFFWKIYWNNFKIWYQVCSGKINGMYVSHSLFTLSEFTTALANQRFRLMFNSPVLNNCIFNFNDGKITFIYLSTPNVHYYTKKQKHSFHILKELFSSDTRQSKKCRIATFHTLMSVGWKKCFQYLKRMYPLFRVIVKFCSTNRLYTKCIVFDLWLVSLWIRYFFVGH